MQINVSNPLLIVDALVNLLLGGLLLGYPEGLAEALGLPKPHPGFYATILGGVLVGIGLALLLENRRTGDSPVGLGLGGAITINLCGAVALTAGILSPQLQLSPLGGFLMWSLVLVLVVVSVFEWVSWRRSAG